MKTDLIPYSTTSERTVTCTTRGNKHGPLGIKIETKR